MTETPWTPPGEGWIEHDGGECPVPPETWVEIVAEEDRKRRRWPNWWSFRPAAFGCWTGHPHGLAVVAYRIMTEGE